jgi:hypothetical protein
MRRFKSSILKENVYRQGPQRVTPSAFPTAQPVNDSKLTHSITTHPDKNRHLNDFLRLNGLTIRYFLGVLNNLRLARIGFCRFMAYEQFGRLGMDVVTIV